MHKPLPPAPRAEDADTPRADDPAAPADAATAEGLQILVVDDDPLVALGLIELLQDEGHRPTEASSAREALDKLAVQAFDVVITDETMPGMTGSELARILHDQWPNVGVVLSTGYADLPDADIAALPRLDKPFRRDQIRAALVQATRR